MFRFFNSKKSHPILPIVDIETIVSECISYLKHKKHKNKNKKNPQKNKKWDLISKRYLKKVVHQKCPGILVQALAYFCKECQTQDKNIAST